MPSKAPARPAWPNLGVCVRPTTRPATATARRALVAHWIIFQARVARRTGNQPRLVTREKNGTLRLAATSCEIRGKSLVFEARYKNLGYWMSADDRALWSVDMPRAGQYEVRLVYACANGTAGNTFELTCADSRLTGKIVGTGTWDNYRTTPLGRVRLPAGRIRVLIAPVGDPANCLMDLQELVLVPVK